MQGKHKGFETPGVIKLMFRKRCAVGTLWGNSLFVWGNSLCHGRGVTKWGVGYKTANARRYR